MQILSDAFEGVTDLVLLACTVWFLILVTPTMRALNRETLDQDIKEDWADVKVALKINYSIIKSKLRRTR